MYHLFKIFFAFLSGELHLLLIYVLPTLSNLQVKQELFIYFMTYNFIEAFPEEEFCRNLFSALHLNVNVKKKIQEYKRLRRKIPFEEIISEFKTGISCPKCNYFKVNNLKKDFYPFKCGSCLSKFSERHNTMFENGKLPLRKYFVSIFLNSCDKELTGKFLSGVIGTNEKTAQKLLAKIRYVKNFTRGSGVKDKESIKDLMYNKYIITTLEDYFESHPNLVEIKRILEIEGLSFISYPGSKRSLIEKIVKRLPVKINNYFEPFLGGGTVFFAINALKQAGVVDIKKMYISDYNKNLIEVFKALKNTKPEDIFSVLDKYKVDYKSLATTEEREAFFKKMKDVYDKSTEGVYKLTSLIFLRKTCHYNSFNFNKQGEFTGSYDKRQDDFKYEKERILKCHESLNAEFVDIKNGSYEEIEDMLQEGDFIYLDPPYYSGRGTMINYGSSLDSKDGQTKIRDFLIRMHKRGVLFMFSNYAHPLIMELYSEMSIFNTQTVTVERNIRGRKLKEHEVIITNY